MGIQIQINMEILNKEMSNKTKMSNMEILNKEMPNKTRMINMEIIKVTRETLQAWFLYLVELQDSEDILKRIEG